MEDACVIEAAVVALPARTEMVPTVGHLIGPTEAEVAVQMGDLLAMPVFRPTVVMEEIIALVSEAELAELAAMSRAIAGLMEEAVVVEPTGLGLVAQEATALNGILPTVLEEAVGANLATGRDQEATADYMAEVVAGDAVRLARRASS